MSAPPAANSVPISQAGSIIGPPVPESIGSVVTRDPDLLVPDEAYEASHDPHQQPALPAAEVAAVATIVRPDDPTPQLPISVMALVRDVVSIGTSKSDLITIRFFADHSTHPLRSPLSVPSSAQAPASRVDLSCKSPPGTGHASYVPLLCLGRNF
jgi:hypothetical protein